ncbi:Excision repair cross-complementation group 1 [Chytridiales sp. JEL 0842]|nr:Excision repair cross-complementation group 1 [Chytridiales sp. JEL 0842]
MEEEAGKYLETFKAFEHKPPDMIKERVDGDYFSKLTACLKEIPTVNKTDVMTLASTFGSLKNIMDATTDELLLCPGFGEQKVLKLTEAVNTPFIMNKRKKVALHYAHAPPGCDIISRTGLESKPYPRKDPSEVKITADTEETLFGSHDFYSEYGLFDTSLDQQSFPSIIRFVEGEARSIKVTGKDI